MFWMRAYPLRREVGGGWALEFSSLLGPVKWEQADRRVPFGAQEAQEFQGPTPSHFPTQCRHPKNYARGCINHSNGYACIQNIMHRAV
jgi:hypothetical protein